MKKVLLADDSVYHRTLLSAILKKYPLQIDMAENGEEAIQKFSTFSPDIVFLDNMMPKINGLDVLRTMKEQKPECIGIMLTVLSSPRDVNSAKTAGADGYILKPFDTAKIVSVLKKFNIIE